MTDKKYTHTGSQFQRRTGPMKYEIYYRELDLGMGDCPDVLIGDARTQMDARKMARADATKHGRILSNYSYTIRGDLFLPGEK